MLERDLYWNSWELLHDLPTVVYRSGTKKALVSYGGKSVVLPARFVDGSFGTPDVQYLMIDGFAARFLKGRKIWVAEAEFWRKRGENQWEFHQFSIKNGPESCSIPQIIGFIADVPEMMRGVARTGPRRRVGL